MTHDEKLKSSPASQPEQIPNELTERIAQLDQRITQLSSSRMANRDLGADRARAALAIRKMADDLGKHEVVNVLGHAAAEGTPEPNK